MTPSAHTELLILGSGPAGYSAAVYAARARLRPLLVTGLVEGSAASLACADPGRSGPGELDAVQGADLKHRLREHSEQASTRVVFDRVRSVSLARRPFRLTGQRGTYTCDALIVAVDGPLEKGLFDGQLEMRDGHIVTHIGLSGMATATSLRGVFVAGDVGEQENSALVTGTGTGCMAALDAQRFLGL
jgi:thioredoxin reductase